MDHESEINIYTIQYKSHKLYALNNIPFLSDGSIAKLVLYFCQ